MRPNSAIKIRRVRSSWPMITLWICSSIRAMISRASSLVLICARIRALIYSPPRRGGVDATSIKYREDTFEGADGVVSSAGTFSQADHPVCAASVASLHFLSGAATPPLRGGECRFFSIRFTAITKVRTIKTPPPADSRMPPQEIHVEIFADRVRLKSGHGPGIKQYLLHSLIDLFVALTPKKSATGSFRDVPHGLHFSTADEPRSSSALEVFHDLP